ncbi:MAG: CBS domain-containing protein [Chloroflexota bacterium]
MTTVREMLRKKGSAVYSISPDATVYEALGMMAHHNTGALMVGKEGNVEGILTERDIVRKVDLAGKSSKETQVSEIMTGKVMYVEASQPLEDCMALMIDKGIRHLPVFDGSEIMGLISIRDVVKEVVDDQQVIIKQLEHYITGGGR